MPARAGGGGLPVPGRQHRLRRAPRAAAWAWPSPWEGLAASDRLGWSVLQIVVALSLVGVLRPWSPGARWPAHINAINRAAQQIASGLPPGELPTERSDEIGALARTFRDMRVQINEQISELRDNQEELEHLAQHDPLTNLPNRRKFQERLDLVRAR